MNLHYPYPTPDLERVTGYRVLREGEIPEVDRAVVDSVHPDPKSRSFATRCIFLQAARDHEDDHHTHPKKLGRDCD